MTANNSSLPIWGTADFQFSISINKGDKIDLKENFNIVAEENFPPICSVVLRKEFLKSNSCIIIYKPEENYFLMRDTKTPLKNCRKIGNYDMYSLCEKEREKTCNVI